MPGHRIWYKLLLCLLAINFNAVADQYLYGKFVAGLQNNQPLYSASGNISGVEDYGSYFGIYGDETITEQTSFIWQIEQLLDITSGQGYNITTANGLIVPNNSSSNQRLLVNINQLATSDSYIGIKSSWGEIKLGNLSNYLRSQMGTVDVFMEMEQMD
jgi:predicted porin